MPWSLTIWSYEMWCRLDNCGVGVPVECLCMYILYLFSVQIPLPLYYIGIVCARRNEWFNLNWIIGVFVIAAI